MPARPTSRGTSARRAQLRPSVRRDPKRAAIHDFNNTLMELVWATQLSESAAVQQYCERLREQFRQAVSR